MNQMTCLHESSLTTVRLELETTVCETRHKTLAARSHVVVKTLCERMWRMTAGEQTRTIQ